MLNLSDKDLDRLSQEAAQQHEPGDIIGPKFWDKLEARLDRDLGKMNPNPARGIRRLPYYYAPAVLVLLGITYYFVRPNNKSQKHTSGSPPVTMTQPGPAPRLTPASSSSSNPVSSDKSNSTLTAPANTVQYPGTPASSGASGTPGTSGTSGSSASGTSGASASSGTSGASATPGASNASAGARTFASGNSNRPSSGNASSRHLRTKHKITDFTAGIPNDKPSHTRTGDATKDASHDAAGATLRDAAGTTSFDSSGTTGTRSSSLTAGSAAGNQAPTSRRPHDLTYSTVRGPIRLTTSPTVDAANPTSVGERVHHGLRVNRSLTFGLQVGPDYSSVNSLSGQKPGSTIGLTADYQFANHWYIGTGLLLSRKIFAAAPQDYHTPPDYYRQNGIGMGNVNYIKGTFNMLEVPINIRYDFNTGGNLLFFVNAGVSSYFFTKENCGYYYTWYNTRSVADKQETYTNHPDNLFSSLNLSLGAELGISNSVSVLMAPYYRIPIRNLGFGQIQLSSVGINFAVRFAPVISRKRY